MQSWFAKGRCMQLWKTEGCLGPAGVRKPPLHTFDTEKDNKQTKKKTNSNKHPSCHYCPNPLDAEKKCHFGKKKKEVCKLLFKKMCKNAIPFFFPVKYCGL